MRVRANDDSAFRFTFALCACGCVLCVCVRSVWSHDFLSYDIIIIYTSAVVGGAECGRFHDSHDYAFHIFGDGIIWMALLPFPWNMHIIADDLRSIGRVHSPHPWTRNVFISFARRKFVVDGVV